MHPQIRPRRRARFPMVFLAVAVAIAAPATPALAAAEVRTAVPVEDDAGAATSGSKRFPFSLRKLFGGGRKSSGAEAGDPQANRGPQPVAKPETVAAEKPDAPSEAEAPRRRGLSRILPFLGGADGAEAEPAEQPTPGAAAAASGRSGAKPIERPARADKFIVTEDDVKFYKDGPLQFQPAEHILSKGDFVTLVVWRKGWCDVKLESGEIGVIGTGQMRKAKASDFPVEEMTVAVSAALEELDRLASSVSLDDVPLLEPVPPPPLPEAADAGEDGGGPIDMVSPLLLPPLVQ